MGVVFVVDTRETAVEFGFELALAAQLEATETLVSRQLGVAVHGRRVMDLVCIEPTAAFDEHLADGRRFVSIDNFSTDHSGFAGGTETADELTKRFEEGTFEGYGEIHFWTEEHIENIYGGFKIEHLTHQVSDQIIPYPDFRRPRAATPRLVPCRRRSAGSSTHPPRNPDLRPLGSCPSSSKLSRKAPTRMSRLTTSSNRTASPLAGAAIMT
jgi:hypothetical protein